MVLHIGIHHEYGTFFLEKACPGPKVFLDIVLRGSPLALSHSISTVRHPVNLATPESKNRRWIAVVG